MIKNIFYEIRKYKELNKICKIQLFIIPKYNYSYPVFPYQNRKIYNYFETNFYNSYINFLCKTFFDDFINFKDILLNINNYISYRGINDE